MRAVPPTRSAVRVLTTVPRISYGVMAGKLLGFVEAIVDDGSDGLVGKVGIVALGA